jgi:Secretion system C-terminal sorting domain
VQILGLYDYNKTKTTFCDTLRVLFTKGNGGSMTTSNIFGGGTMGTGGHYPSVTFWDMIYDSVTNKASGFVTADLHYQDIVLCNSGATPAWGDTNSVGTWFRTIAVNGASGISCAAGDVLGCSFTFISGDPATKGAGKLASPTPGDTLVTSSVAGMNKYNVWRPLITYYSDAAGAATWAPYLETATPVADHNIGLWKTLPSFRNGWDTVYVPMWAWSSSGGASGLQYPFINWHVTCPTCALITNAYLGVNNTAAISSINAVPNPANNQASIVFTLAQASDVSVSLTNVVGQVVATQEIANTSNGRATFNTTNLPSGVYVYTISANGEKATGRIVVAH